MVLGYMADHRPHNPLVAGSSPACPTFSIHTSEEVFEYYANVAKTSFYAIFTQSTTNNQRNSKQHLFLPTDFSEIFSYFLIFSWEQWEFWERNSFSLHLQQLTIRLTVPVPLNRPWDRWERRKILFIGKSRPNHAKNSQIFLELRNKCVKTAHLIAHTKESTPLLEGFEADLKRWEKVQRQEMAKSIEWITEKIDKLKTSPFATHPVVEHSIARAEQSLTSKDQ
jgi:hypothetical protein